MSRTGAIAVGTVAAIVAVTLSIVGAAAPGQAAPKVNGSLTLSPASGAPGTTITISGTIPPYDRHRVQLQRREASGVFTTLATQRTDNDGRFTFRATLPQDRTAAIYRAVSPQGHGGVRAYVTPARSATISGIVRITHGSGGVYDSAISADGRHVAYVFSDDDNDIPGIFTWDRRRGTSIRLPHSRAGSGPAISGNGRFVAYDFLAEEVRVWDRTTGTTRSIGVGEYPGISADGRYVAYYGHDEVVSRVLKVWDRATGTTTNVGEAGGYCGPTISHDGRYVTFPSGASDLVPNDVDGTWQVLLWDRTTGTTIPVTGGNGGSYCPHISTDGRYVAFASEASDLVPDDTNGKQDVFLWKAATGSTVRLTNGNRDSSPAGISGDGRYVSFSSNATDLLPGTQTKPPEVYLWDRTDGTTTSLTNGNRISRPSDISADGRSITFVSEASDLVPHDTKGSGDLFLWTKSRAG